MTYKLNNTATILYKTGKKEQLAFSYASNYFDYSLEATLNLHGESGAIKHIISLMAIDRIDLTENAAEET